LLFESFPLERLIMKGEAMAMESSLVGVSSLYK
jgi:hypothetical protein